MFHLFRGMIPNYEVYLLIQILSLSAHFVVGQEIECIKGETWFERCKKCECLGNHRYGCRWHLPSCNIGTLRKGVFVFESNRRCHYSIELLTTICVDMSFQKNLNGNPCSTDIYVHDSCSFCRCEKSTKTYECKSIDKCSATNGICNSGETVMENICFRCSCTFTRFRVCSPFQQCFDKIEKEGKCPTHQNVYPRMLQEICTYERYQECYTDYGCPGAKKCCPVVDCFLRCVDAIY
ncbi:unnamed protein product [Phaedon cochleariae]|uniref:WAP domain-containing protein n=1 Tax=Phaedon cochleariae TaxID=80249 RepID=A0A9N9SJI7_PHACE|nr:unnamed protein product [Phaedon cochleariae]